jgi:hypothetical protein
MGPPKHLLAAAVVQEEAFTNNRPVSCFGYNGSWCLKDDWSEIEKSRSEIDGPKRETL